MIITVFGASQPVPGSSAYEDAYQVGKMIALAGHTVVTGGYIGTMEAVSKGANQSGGHVIGVTCEDIERWRKGTVNPWVKEEIKCPDLIDRLRKLIGICDMAIALPGGPGTLTEISLMWNLMIVESIPRKKMILLGKGWSDVIESAAASLNPYFTPGQKELLTFSPTIDSIPELNQYKN